MRRNPNIAINVRLVVVPGAAHATNQLANALSGYTRGTRMTLC